MVDFRHLGNLTLEQQSRLEKLSKEVTKAGYVERTDDVTLVFSYPFLVSFVSLAPESVDCDEMSGCSNKFPLVEQWTLFND